MINKLQMEKKRNSYRNKNWNYYQTFTTVLQGTECLVNGFNTCVCVCVCMCKRIYTNTHACMYLYVCAYANKSFSILKIQV